MITEYCLVKKLHWIFAPRMEETSQATLIGRRKGQSYNSHQSPSSVWKSYILALTRRLMSNYLWTCQFQRRFCVCKYKGSMTKIPSWSSMLNSLRSFCFKCSGLFAHFTDEKLSIRGCHLLGKQLVSGIGNQIQASWLLLRGEVLSVHWEEGAALMAWFGDHCVP